jgi:hypothetical protein
MFRLAALAFLVFLLNLPFGYWRTGVRRFSAPWILAIHSPVPAVAALRLGLGIGWAWPTFPPLVGAFFLGQICGGGLKRSAPQVEGLPLPAWPWILSGSEPTVEGSREAPSHVQGRGRMNPGDEIVYVTRPGAASGELARPISRSTSAVCFRSPGGHSFPLARYPGSQKCLVRPDRRQGYSPGAFLCAGSEPITKSTSPPGPWANGVALRREGR